MARRRCRIILAALGGCLAFLVLIFPGEGFLTALVRFPVYIWRFLIALPQRLLWTAAVVATALIVSVKLPPGRMSGRPAHGPTRLSRWEDLAARTELAPRSKRMREHLARRLAALSSGRGAAAEVGDTVRWLKKLTPSGRSWRKEEFYRTLGDCLREIRTFERQERT